ncbi:hypothetical protein OPIT5_05945 [Opitutaceae bacterium TAV5]|nr:hypothetical protein OPIT5_05945 [Opitutaceae bacterium TAV5]
MTPKIIPVLAVTLAAALVTTLPAADDPASAGRSAWVFPGADGKLVYRADERGNTLPDFSRAGYHGGGVALPAVPVAIALDPSPAQEAGAGVTVAADDGERIQQALDTVAGMTADAAGQRGAVLLRRGTWRVAGDLRVPDGVVLRGEGSAKDGTMIIATGTQKRTLIRLGEAKPATAAMAEVPGSRRRVAEDYVPASSRTLALERVDDLKAGDRVVVLRPGTAAWIASIGMDRIVARSPEYKMRQWEPAEYDFHIERFVTAVDAEARRVTLDAPLMIALEKEFGGGWLYRAESRRARECGVESLCLVSEYKAGQETSDSDHATTAINTGAVENAWVRDVAAWHFDGGVSVGRNSLFITIRDSAHLDPVGPIVGGYRYGFHLGGQYTLVEGCRTRGDRHSFVTSSRVRGPNVFLGGVAEQSHADSGPHHRFAIGTLYDNIRESNAINVQDRGDSGTGHGWTGAQQVLWNCTAPKRLVLQRPPGAQNYAIGCVARFDKGRLPREEGVIDSPGVPVQPASLYRAQLAERLVSGGPDR